MLLSLSLLLAEVDTKQNVSKWSLHFELSKTFNEHNEVRNVFTQVIYRCGTILGGYSNGSRGSSGSLPWRHDGSSFLSLVRYEMVLYLSEDELQATYECYRRQ